jgi:hypothetical protein
MAIIKRVRISSGIKKMIMKMTNDDDNGGLRRI